MKFLLEQIQDPVVRKTLQDLQGFLRDSLPFYGFKPFVYAYAGSPTSPIHVKIPHNLGYTPKDVLTTFTSGSGTITFNYALFNSSTLDATVSGPVSIRGIAGTFQKVSGV